MRYSVAVVSVAVFFLGCGGSTSPSPTAPFSPTPPPPPPPPVAAASIVVDGAFSVPGCEAKRALYWGMGLRTVSCPTFSATMRNAGPGCAVNIRGIATVAAADGSKTGSASWSYPQTVRSGERFVISGGPLTIPSGGEWWYSMSVSWDDVRCP